MPSHARDFRAAPALAGSTLLLALSACGAHRLDAIRAPDTPRLPRRAARSIGSNGARPADEDRGRDPSLVEEPVTARELAADGAGSDANRGEGSAAWIFCA